MSENSAPQNENDASALLYVAVRQHEPYWLGAGRVACSCDHRARSLHDDAEHRVEALMLAGVQIIPPVPTSAEEPLVASRENEKERSGRDCICPDPLRAVSAFCSVHGHSPDLCFPPGLPSD